MKKFARTWGCKLDPTDLAPPETHQAAGYPGPRRKRATWTRVPRRFGARGRTWHVEVLTTRITRIARARRDVQKHRLDLDLKPRTKRLGSARTAPSARYPGPRRKRASRLQFVCLFQFVCFSEPGSVRFRIGFVSPQVSRLAVSAVSR